MPVSRRVFLRLAVSGSAAAVAGVAGAKNPQRLISYVEPVDARRPGTVVTYATTCRECPAGCGMHVWQREARPTKVEGNPDHPVNTGRLCPRGHSSLQGLYDPDRLQTPMRLQGDERTSTSWPDALRGIGEKLAAASRVQIISDLQTGLLEELMHAFTRQFGGKAILYEPLSYRYLVEGHAAARMPAVVPHYHLEQSRYILSFAADFLETWISPVEFARAFIHNRDLHDGAMGRFTYVGPRQSMTAGNADEMHLLTPSKLASAAWAILAGVLTQAADTGSIASRAGDRLANVSSPFAPDVSQRIARELVESGSGIVLAGSPGAGSAAAELAMACALINEAIGATGKRVDYGEPHSLTYAIGNTELAREIVGLDQNAVVIVHSTNPAYSAPGLADQLRKAGVVVWLGTTPDETAMLADWDLPIDQNLEAWGEYAPYPGINGFVQPSMGRLYDTHAAGDVLLDLARAAGKPLDGSEDSFADRLRARFGALLAPALPRGFTRQGAPRPPEKLDYVPPSPIIQPIAADSAELWVYPSIMFYDGRLANRSWMQEIPDPLSFAAWGTWVDMHPRKAIALGLKQDAVVHLEQGGQAIEAPVRITEETDPDTIAVHLGTGHLRFGRYASNFGANAWAIAAGQPGAFFGRVKIQGTGRTDSPAYLSPTEEQHHREILQWVPVAQAANPKPGERDELIMPLPEGYQQNRDLYPPHHYKEHRWAMVVDLNRCIGCGACTAACYAENNVPVVGREQVGLSREMAWLRVVPYRNQDDPHKVGWLPLLCQQCDAAPCEPVCPVFASVHNEEGLNAQVYNRCIGTRYCNNNCPYKVRRFNWYAADFAKPLDLQLNPEVTVRSRGVMEKCTFCIQRIRAAEYKAKIEKRHLRDGEIMTACQQTCPTDVFTFGDLMDEGAAVTKRIRNDARGYQVLKDLNTKPAVIYLKRIDGSNA